MLFPYRQAPDKANPPRMGWLILKSLTWVRRKKWGNQLAAIDCVLFIALKTWFNFRGVRQQVWSRVSITPETPAQTLQPVFQRAAFQQVCCNLWMRSKSLTSKRKIMGKRMKIRWKSLWPTNGKGWDLNMLCFPHVPEIKSSLFDMFSVIIFLILIARTSSQTINPGHWHGKWNSEMTV